MIQFLKTTLTIAALAFAAVLGGCANEVVDKPSEHASLPQEAEMLEAAGQGDTARVRDLLDKGVNVNMRGPHDQTPIMEATYAGHMDTVRLLLDNGADLSAKKRDGATPLTLTANKALLSLFKDVAALVSAAAAGDNQAVKALLDKGTPVNGLDQTGQSALHAASSNDKTETVKLLLELGANPHIINTDGASPLALALVQERDGVAALLKEAIRKRTARAPVQRTGSPASTASPAPSK